MLAEQFKQITNLDFEVISTVDHPYTSPPIRLLDSHILLHEINKDRKVCVLNWDVSQPSDRTYRYDLQIDVGVLARNKQLFLFKKSIPYVLQTPKDPLDLDIYNNILKQVLDRMVSHKKLAQGTASEMSDNYDKLKKHVILNMQSEHGRLAADYTKRSLTSMYSLLSRNDVGNFIKDAYLYYFKSTLMNKWIPYCIENATGKRAVDSVMENGVFGRKVFRSLSTDLNEELLNDATYIADHKSELANLIRDNKIIPSIEMLYWSLELGNKYHFGNDYDFFERYQNYLGESLSNQLTAMKTDGINYFQMKKDYGVSYDIGSGKFNDRNSSSQVKDSRINSMFAFYIFLGDRMKNEIPNPESKSTKTVEIINGEVVVT